MKFLFTHTIGLFYSNITSVQLLKNFFNISLVILSPIILVSFPDKLAKAAASTLYDTAALYITC